MEATHEIRLSSGTIRYREAGPAGADAPVLVFVHGLLADGLLWRKVVRDAPIHALVGGLHLYALDDERLDWTADQLRASGLQTLLGAHCTGIEAVYRIRQRAGLDRKRAVVGAVGSSFTLGQGLDPRDLAR